MGGDDSQKLLPRRGVHSSPGRKPPAQLTKSTISLILAVGLSRALPGHSGYGLSYSPSGSFLESTGGSILGSSAISVQLS